MQIDTNFFNKYRFDLSTVNYGNFFMKIIKTLGFKILVLLMLTLITFQAKGQEVDTTMGEQSLIPRIAHNEKIAFKLNYFGELILHPGFTTGIEYTLTKNNWLAIHSDFDVGGYWHRWNNTSLFLKTSIGSRFTIGPVFADLNVGIGYMHSFAAGPVYQRSSNGDVERTTNWGKPYFMPNASLLFGWDRTKKNKKIQTVFIGPEIYLQYPHNHIFLPHIALKAGITYKFMKK